MYRVSVASSSNASGAGAVPGAVGDSAGGTATGCCSGCGIAADMMEAVGTDAVSRASQ